MVARHRPALTRVGRRGVALVAVVTILLGACSGGGDDVSGDPISDPVDSEPTAQPPAESPPDEVAPDEAPATIEPPLALAGTSWIPTNYRQFDGAITNPVGEGVLLVFEESGTLSGHTGCNDFEGTWELTGPYVEYDDRQKALARLDPEEEEKLDGQPISITAELTTDAECAFPEQDPDFITSLVGAEIWFIGNTLGDQTAGITLSGEDAFVMADPA